MRHAFGRWRMRRTDAAALDALRAELGEGVTWRWTPQGVSASFVTPGRTIVVHTWPERGVATIDVWAEQAERVAADVGRKLGWTAVVVREVERSPARRRAVGA